MNIIRNLYIHERFFIYISVIVAMFLASYWIDMLYTIAWLLFLGLSVLFIFDLVLLFRFKNGINARRLLPDKFSNADENPVPITILNDYPFKIFAKVVDELPKQFQKRDFNYETTLEKFQSHEFEYQVRPVERGEYYFGVLNIYVSSKLQIIARRYRFDASSMVAV